MGFEIKNLSLMAIACAVTPMVAGAATPCVQTHLDLRGDWGQAQFSIEIADDLQERAQGLMFREEMARMAGMLFIYETAQPVSFWMKNTLLPLDMIFLNPAGTVTAIHENAVPGDLTPIPGGDGVLYVLELNAGTVEMLGISVQSELRHPRIDQKNAVWACEVQ